MRALENIIRQSTERLAARQDWTRLGHKAQMTIIVGVLIIGGILIVCWMGAMLYFTYRLASYLFS